MMELLLMNMVNICTQWKCAKHNFTILYLIITSLSLIESYLGLIWQPTWGHLRELHAAVKQSSEPLLFGTYSNLSIGQEQEVKLNKVKVDSLFK